MMESTPGRVIAILEILKFIKPFTTTFALGPLAPAMMWAGYLVLGEFKLIM